MDSESPKTKFSDAIARLFSEEEIKQLCFNLGVDFEELEGGTKSAKVRSLITYNLQRGELQNLLDVVKKERPKENWPNLAEDIEENASWWKIHRSAQDWLKSNKEPSLLYRGKQLANTQDWVSQHSGFTSPDVDSFLKESLHEEENRKIQEVKSKARAKAIESEQKPLYEIDKKLSLAIESIELNTNPETIACLLQALNFAKGLERINKKMKFGQLSKYPFAPILYQIYQNNVNFISVAKNKDIELQSMPMPDSKNITKIGVLDIACINDEKFLYIGTLKEPSGQKSIKQLQISDINVLQTLPLTYIPKWVQWANNQLLVHGYHGEFEIITIETNFSHARDLFSIKREIVLENVQFASISNNKAVLALVHEVSEKQLGLDVRQLNSYQKIDWSVSLKNSSIGIPPAVNDSGQIVALSDNLANLHLFDVSGNHVIKSLPHDGVYRPTLDGIIWVDESRFVCFGYQAPTSVWALYDQDKIGLKDTLVVFDFSVAPKTPRLVKIDRPPSLDKNINEIFAPNTSPRLTQLLTEIWQLEACRSHVYIGRVPTFCAIFELGDETKQLFLLSDCIDGSLVVIVSSDRNANYKELSRFLLNNTRFPDNILIKDTVDLIAISTPYQQAYRCGVHFLMLNSEGVITKTGFHDTGRYTHVADIAFSQDGNLAYIIEISKFTPVQETLVAFVDCTDPDFGHITFPLEHGHDVTRAVVSPEIKMIVGLSPKLEGNSLKLWIFENKEKPFFVGAILENYFMEIKDFYFDVLSKSLVVIDAHKKSFTITLDFKKWIEKAKTIANK